MVSKQTRIQIAAWCITLISIVLAVIVWGQSLRWHVFGTSTYLLFPIFGLIAFSLLWSQYVSTALRQCFKADSSALANYFTITGWLVLAAILLHPGLLIWQLWRDGAGLPPNSELHYVLPGLRGFVILGMINLTIFLLFELRRIFSKQSWWRPFTYIVDLAVLLVFLHGLKLGTQLQTGWYRKIWFFYGFSFLVSLAYIYRNRFINRHQARATS
jgi:hypothetical protein